ncbi:MAG: hypothetical protein V1747_07540 [Candidatus Omnitrophota bacterium]
MKKFLCVFILFGFILGSCAPRAKMPQLQNSLSLSSVIELWGDPKEKIQVGTTSQNYPVELWKYSFKKNSSISGNQEEWVLIFVDSELYFWAEDDPDKIFKELVNLGVYDQEQIELLENKASLQNTATKTEENRKTMEIIRTYQFYQNTQMQIQTQQLMQTIRRQQIYIPPPLPPAPPAKPIRQ